jgi:hypothetical protein
VGIWGHYFAIGSEKNGLGGYFQQQKYIFVFTGAIDHTPQIFYGHFRALARSRPFPDLHCNDEF